MMREAGLQSYQAAVQRSSIHDIRVQICHDKVDAEGWLAIHRTAHNMGMVTNATACCTATSKNSGTVLIT